MHWSLQFTYLPSLHNNIAVLLASTGKGETDCEVTTKLYLMCPDTMKKDVDIILVNDDNVMLCMDLWKRSCLFDFDRAFQIKFKDGTSCALGMLSIVYWYNCMQNSLQLQREK